MHDSTWAFRTLRRSTFHFLLIPAVALGACARGEPKPPETPPAEVAAALPRGEGRLAVDGGEIWYRVSGTGTGVPVILIHGGPGYSSFYLKSLEALGDDRPVVRYDQLGSGKSGPMTDTLMMTIPHFVAELDSLRAALGFAKVHLLGHSWGTLVAMEYYRAHPEHVVSVTFASAALDIPAYAAHARALVKTLPDSTQRAILEGERSKAYDSPGYQAAMNEFYGRYVWRHPVQADLDSTFATVNMAIYNYMQGPSEFTITGTFKDYNSTAALRTMQVPVLFTVGEFDEVGPDIIRKQAGMTPGAKYALIPGSAHITTWDNPVEMLKVVRAFLREADATAAAKR